MDRPTKISDLLVDESKWTTSVFARDDIGMEVDAESPDACSWCLQGAVIYCVENIVNQLKSDLVDDSYIETWKEVFARHMLQRLKKAIAELTGEEDMKNIVIAHYNDTRTFKEIMNVVRLSESYE